MCFLCAIFSVHAVTKADINKNRNGDRGVSVSCVYSPCLAAFDTFWGEMCLFLKCIFFTQCLSVCDAARPSLTEQMGNIQRVKLLLFWPSNNIYLLFSIYLFLHPVFCSNILETINNLLLCMLLYI